MAAVGGDAVDGALVSLEFTQGPERVCVPQFEHTSSAATKKSRRTWDDAQRTHPVTVSVWNLLMKRRFKGKQCQNSVKPEKFTGSLKYE